MCFVVNKPILFGDIMNVIVWQLKLLLSMLHLHLAKNQHDPVCVSVPPVMTVTYHIEVNRSRDSIVRKGDVVEDD